MRLESKLREIEQEMHLARPLEDGAWGQSIYEQQSAWNRFGALAYYEYMPWAMKALRILARAVKATEDWYTHTATCQECGRDGRYCALALDLLRDAGDAHRAAVKLLETGEMPK